MSRWSRVEAAGLIAASQRTRTFKNSNRLDAVRLRPVTGRVKSNWSSARSARRLYPDFRPTGRYAQSGAEAMTWNRKLLAPAAAALLLVACSAKAAPRSADFLAGKVKDCPGCDLAGANLKRLDLTGAVLAGAIFSHASFHREFWGGGRLFSCKSHRRQLRQSQIVSQADFRGADLSGSFFFEAVALKADFSGANLSGSHMGNVRLGLANLSGAGELSGSDLGGAGSQRRQFRVVGVVAVLVAVPAEPPPPPQDTSVNASTLPHTIWATRPNDLPMELNIILVP